MTLGRLFAAVKNDRIKVDEDTLWQAKNGDSDSMADIGREYEKKKDYETAMTWYRLAAAKNNAKAQNDIGILFGRGLGVPKNYIFALEWHLKAATQNNKIAWGCIGLFFERGRGVPVDKYKALEWYYKSGANPEAVKELRENGIRLTAKEKNKPIEVLIIQTEEIFWEARRRKYMRLARDA